MKHDFYVYRYIIVLQQQTKKQVVENEEPCNAVIPMVTENIFSRSFYGFEFYSDF
jgi:hypothetical protein